METLSFTLDGDPVKRTWPIAGDVFLTTYEQEIAPVIAIAHGWLGHKDRGLLPDLARALATAGFVAVSFNFSGSGVAAAADEIADEDRFAANTFSREVEDLERIVTAIFERVLPGRERFDIYKIGVVGIDAGGGVALIEAAGDTRVKALASIAAPARLEEVLTREAIEDLIARGEHLFRDPRSGRPLRLDREIYRDLRARTDPERPADAPPADVVPAAGAIAIPYLVLHGDADARFPLEDARAIFFAGHERAELEVIAGGDHELDGGAGTVGAAVIRFFEKRLR